MSDEEIIEKAQQLIAIPSTADRPNALREALEVIAALLSSDPQITVERFTHHNVPSLLAYAGPVRPERFAVILNGHLDVVTGKPDQFIPHITDNKLFGRGAQDMKTAAVVMTDVFLRHVHNVGYPLGLQIVTDEEVGGFNGTYWQVSQGVRTDFGIMGEHHFVRDAIYTSARGLSFVELTFKGKTAHGGYVWHGDNAIVRASRFAQAVLDVYPIPEHELWGTTANIASIHTRNTIFNRIPDEATLRIDFRFTPKDKNFTSIERMETFLRSIDPDIAIKIDVFSHAVMVDTKNPYLQELAHACETVNGKKPAFLNRFAGADTRHFVPYGGACVEYGLLGNGPHSDQEYVDLSNIPTYKKTLETFLYNARRVAAYHRQSEEVHQER